MQHVRGRGPLRVSSNKLSLIFKGLPLFLLLAWVTKAFSPDFNAKSALLARSYLSILIPMMLFGGFLIISVIWSDHPDDTLRRGIRQVILFTSVAGAVVISRSQDRFVNYIQFFSVSLLIYEALFLLIPHISFDIFGNFTGLHRNKNEFGGIAGAFLLIAVCVYRYYAETRREKKMAIFCIFGWVALLLISGSKTPMGFVALLAPLAIMLSV